MKQKPRRVKTYVLFWITLLALCMSALLTYQGTRYFLDGFDSVQKWQMTRAADLLPDGETSLVTDFGYHVTRDWQAVPADIRRIFPDPPQQHYELQLHMENWWYFAPPEKSYSLLSALNEAGELRYISKKMEHAKKDKPRLEGLDPMVMITLWGIGSLIAFVAIIYKILSNLTSPVQALYDWARTLDLNQANDTPPDFQYDELNQLAAILQENLKDMNQTLEREKEFLGFASHELRTPITTLRSNATLLDKISPNPTPKEREVRDRILRATLTMKGMTETLLWLSRDSQEVIETSPVDIQNTLQQVVQELNYLLTGKAITLSVQTRPCTLALPEAAFRILVSNIIRNAFQHTTDGEIRIIQDERSVTVSNTLPHSANQTPTDQTTLRQQPQNQTGFGLGLKLIRKIVTRFDWALQEQQRDSVLHMTVVFESDGNAGGG